MSPPICFHYIDVVVESRQNDSRKRNRKEIRTTLASSIRSICSHVLCGVSYAYGRRKSFAMSFIILYS